jgi:hypothetical protein
MHISRSSRIERRIAVLTMCVLAAARLLADAPGRPCSAFSAAKSIAGNTATFQDNRFPWKVTADLDGKITIENTRKKTRCSADVESVVSVYIGKGDLIYFRSTEIASDELFTLNGFSCKQAAKVKRLSAGSESKAQNTLRANGICTTH